ncbi:MAG: response regulator [Candidatus Desulfacyla sp.]
MGRHLVDVLKHSGGERSRFGSRETIGVRDVYKRTITTELLFAKRHLEAMLEGMAEGILEINSEGRLIYANSAACSFLNMQVTDLLGAHFTEMLSDPSFKRVGDLLKRLGEPPKKVFEESAVELNGHQLRLDILPIQDGQESTAIIIFSDVTEQKRMEEILDQAQKMEALGTIAGGIAHDFNNLLMGIQGNVSLILAELEPDHIHFDKLKAIENYVQSGADLANQLLGLGRSRSRNFVPTNLNDLINKSSSMFGRTNKEIVIHRRLEENLWITATDPVQIEQVLINLYVNAWQAMTARGTLCLETENVTLSEQFVNPYGVQSGRYAKMSISDNGTGMSRETMKRIFEPFFTTKERGKGTGLGLASTYRIVRSHGGFVTVSSKVGAGTTFDIFLPASGDKAFDARRSSAKPVMGKGTIQFIDDEEGVLDVTKQMLENMGYRSLTAKSGREAIEVYKEHWSEIDMVILDMTMPDMGGGETFEKLCNINPGIKALLSSGYDLNEEVSEILARGFKGFIQKPFTMRELSEKLRETLENE